MTCVDVNCFRCSGSGASGRWWYGPGGFVDQSGKVDTVVGKGVIDIGGVIPLHMGELAEVRQVIKLEASVREKFGDVKMLWSVLGFELCSVEIKPPCYLLLSGEVVEMWRWCLPRWVRTLKSRKVGIFCLGHVGDLAGRCRVLIGSESDGWMRLCMGLAARRCGG